jgi:serine/threonine protein kinase
MRGRPHAFHHRAAGGWRGRSGEADVAGKLPRCLTGNHTYKTHEVGRERVHMPLTYLHTWCVSRTVFTCCPLTQLASALAHVHECGIAHLDIKPANVLLAADGSIRLADFGIAARAPALRHRGTPLFAAPEVSDRLHVRWSVYIRVCTCSVFDVVSICGARGPTNSSVILTLPRRPSRRCLCLALSAARLTRGRSAP